MKTSSPLSSLGRSKSTSALYQVSKSTADDQLSLCSSSSPPRPKRHSIAPLPSSPPPPPRAKLTLTKKCTYLDDDIRRRYTLGYEAAAPVAQQNSFVKKFVATLERRRADSERAERGPRELAKPSPPRKRTPKRASRLRGALRSPRPQAGQPEDERPPPSPPPPPPKRPDHGLSLKLTAQRAFRKVSSMLGWKSPRSLPKGSRDYYADRESLSDELGAFRRETVPKLMKKSGLGCPDPSCARLCEQVHFPRLTGSSSSSSPRPSPSHVAHATIHRGHSIRARDRLDELSHYQIPRCHLREEGPAGEVRFRRSRASSPPRAYASRPSRVQEPRAQGARPRAVVRPSSPPPPVPTQPSQPTQPTQPSPPDTCCSGKLESLDSGFSSVQLRRRQPTATIYDVPSSGSRSVSLSSSPGTSVVQLVNAPVYENAKLFVHADKRLNLTEFTTF